jgi:hypothetical protein
VGGLLIIASIGLVVFRRPRRSAKLAEAPAK